MNSMRFDNPPCPVCGTSSPRKHQTDTVTVHLCGNCGLEFIHPRPTMEETTALYDRSYYDSWGLETNDTTEKMKKATFSDKLDIIHRFAPKGGRLLDIGCATGFFLDVAALAGWDTYGVELSPYSSDIARRKIGSGKIFTGTVEDAAFSDDYFDVIVMTDVIEHVGEPGKFISELARILRPGGVVAITTPDPETLSCRLMGKYWPHYKQEHLMYFSSRSLELLIEPLGFSTLYASSAQKALTLDYMSLQFSTYPVPLVTPLIKMSAGILPRALSGAPFRINSGELLLIARLDKRNKA